MATVTVTTSQNLSTVVYAADDDIVINPAVTLTVTATPGLRVRSFAGTTPNAKLFVQNTSTTNLLKIAFPPATRNGTTGVVNALEFRNGGIVEFDGGWITIYTGTGAANQTVLGALTVGGLAVDTINFVEVETGSGTGIYEKWTVVPRNVANFWQSQYGYNAPNITTGTVSVTSGGLVTVTGNTFNSTLTTAKRFRAAGHATDYIISSTPSTTTLQLTNADGNTYSGGAIGAGATYQIRVGSAYDTFEFYNNDRGTVLFLDPYGGAPLGSAQNLVCGDGTNGKVIPNGAKVRVPNIFVTSDLASTTLSAAITGTTAANISLTSATNFPATNTAYTDTTCPGTLLVYDTTGKAERIGFTTITAGVVQSTGMTRGAFNSVAQTFANGSTVYYFPALQSGTGTNIVKLYVNGTIKAKNVMFSPFLNVCTGSTSDGILQGNEGTFENCGFSARILTGNPGPISNFKLKNISICTDSRWSNSYNDYDQVSIFSINGTCYLEDIFASFGNSYFVGGGRTHFNVNAVTNITKADLIKIWTIRAHTSGNAALNVSTTDNVTFSNLTLVGQFNFNSCINVKFSGIKHAGSGSVGEAYNPTQNQIFRNNGNNFNVIVRGITNYEGAFPAYGTRFTGNSNSDYILINNKGYAAFDGRNVAIGNFGVQTHGNYCTLAWLNFINNRLGSSLSYNGELIGYGTRRIRLTGTAFFASPLQTTAGPGTLFGGEIDLQAGPNPRTGTQSEAYDVQVFTVNTDSTAGTSGYVCAGPFCPDYLFTNTFSGLSTTAYLNGAGALYITTTGDQVIMSSKYAMKGWSSFNTGGTITFDGNTSGNITAGSGNNCTFEFRMCKWGDSISALAWQSLTLSNLETTRAAISGYSTTVGFNIQIRITANTTTSARYFNLIRMPGTWDTAYNPPVGYFNYQLTNVLTGSTVALSKDGGTTFTEITTATSSTVTLPVYSDYLGNTINYVVRVRKPGYEPVEITGSVLDDVTYIGNVGVTSRVEQVQIKDANGVAVYGTGSTSAFVTLDYAALRIDIGNAVVSGPNLYDTVTNNACDTTGIKYAWPIGFSGLATDFDVVVQNTWKLRRKLVTDTNAAISKFVLYGPNPALSPVDTVNGTVGLSHTFSLSFTGLLTGSRVALSVDGGTNWSTALSAGSSVSFNVVFTTYNGTVNYLYKVRKAGYVYIDSSGTAAYQNNSVPVTQAALVDANGQPIYGNGTTSALVSIAPAALRIDIGNGSVNGPDLYDTVVDWECTATGITYAQAISTPGTPAGYDLTVLNTWKLRRKLVTDTNAAVSVFVLYGPNPALSPVDTVNGTVALSHTFTLSITGSLNTSVIALSLDAGSSWSTATSTGATVTFPVVFTTYGGTQNYIIRVRLAGYTCLEYTGAIVYSDASIPASQVEVLDINGVAVYGRGAGTTSGYITIVQASLRVDIGNILVVGEDLYDVIADWQATTTGIQYPEVLQFNGTDSIILNTWKLRRDLVGSTNAMIDMAVFYAPNTALNPVDEVNGSVQMFPRVVRQIGGITSAADVWDYAKTSATTPGSMGEQVAKKLLELSKFIALK